MLLASDLTFSGSWIPSLSRGGLFNLLRENHRQSRAIPQRWPPRLLQNADEQQLLPEMMPRCFIKPKLHVRIINA